MSDAVLLDTHAWLWFFNGDRRLKAAAIKRFEKAAEAGQLWVSVISVWEIGLLNSRGRIVLGRSAEEWTAEALAQPGLRLAGLEPPIALAASRLPGECHGDRADRILIATARHLDMPLATADGGIHAYAVPGYLKIFRLS